MATSTAYDDLVQALVDTLVDDFTLSDDEIQALADAILDGRVETFEDAYAAVADVVGAYLADDWTLSDDDRTTQRDAALAAAAAIAATYASDLTSRATSLAQDWADAHDGALDGSEASLRDDLASYAEERAGWKADQVASYETGAAANDGTSAAVEDVLNGDLLDAAGDAIDYGAYYVVVLPEESSSDFCAEFAGRVFAFDDAPMMDFPAHQNCIHYIVVVSLDEPLDSEDDLDLDEPL